MSVRAGIAGVFVHASDNHAAKNKSTIAKPRCRRCGSSHCSSAVEGGDVDKDEEYRLRDENHARNEARKEIADKLRGLKRHNVGSADEGGGYMYDYADESKDGRWVKWDDVKKLIDDLVR